MTLYADHKPLTFHDATRRFTDGNDSPRAYLVLAGVQAGLNRTVEARESYGRATSTSTYR